MADTFTNEQRLTAIVREIGFRKRVFTRKVATGEMSSEKAAYEINIMQAIASDYRKRSEGERLL